jgi:DNA-directed RNA polymerase specialized sigma24 family protein
MRRGYRRPQVPWDVRGLFTALRSERRGDGAPLGAWMGAGFPALRRSLEASGLDPAEADDAASEVVARALRAQRRGAAIQDECAWMSSVAGNLRVDAARARRTAPLSLSLSWRFP